MKILYLNPDRGIPVLGDKGASVHVREFMTALAQLDHDALLLCASLGAGNEPPPGRIVEITPDNGDAVIESEHALRNLPASLLSDRTARRELVRLAYERSFRARVEAALAKTGFKPDLIYERYALFHCAGSELARKLRVPRLLEVNAPLIREQAKFRGLCLKQIAQSAEHASFNGADRVIAVSDEVAGYVASCGIAEERIVTVPNGVDLKRFHPDAGGDALRERLGLGTDPVIGFIGSFKPWHGVGFLIEAFAAMVRRTPALRLLCVGDGPELEVSRQRIAAFGLERQAVFTGRVPHAEIPAYLAAMDVSVAPYQLHGDFYFSPLKVVESLAAGTPVIAPRVGQLEKLVADGATGILFAPGDCDDFVEKSLTLMGDAPARRRMSAAARAHALSAFSWQRAASDILACARDGATAVRAA